MSVPESIRYPEQILTVQAKDSDAVLTDEDKENGFAEVRYTLRGENAELLTIDEVTGVIKVRNNLASIFKMNFIHGQAKWWGLVL